MKITTFLLIVTLAQVSVRGLAQNITFKQNNVSLKKVFKEISKQTGYNVFWPSKLINSQRIDAMFDNTSITSVLEFCLQGLPLIYSIDQKTIIVKEKEKPPMNTNVTFHTIDIRGQVADEKGGSLPGATVRIKGSNQGIVADHNGKFSLTSLASNAVLVVSYTGFISQEVPVDGQRSITIVLKEHSARLNEIVVVGYGAVKKSSVTAAISKVDSKYLDQIPAGRAEIALVGSMSGVNISTVQNRAGEAPIIRIRGAASLDAQNDPLIVIDGFPGGSFNNVNMNDVESIEVLKDASSAAIYGSRGSGGVIIVTTRKGKAGKAQLSFNAYAGIASPMGHNDWISGQEYYDYAVRYQNREYVWAGGDPNIPVWGDSRRPASYQVNPVIKERNVNWQDAIFQAAPIQNYNLTVSGGNENVNYYVSGTFNNEQGTLVNTLYKRYSLRANVNFKINSVISTGFMMNPNYSGRRNFINTGIQNLVRYPPFVAVRNPDGTYSHARNYWGVVVAGALNPMAILQATEDYTDVMNNVGEAYLNLNILPGLSFKSSIGSNITFNTNDYYQAGFGNVLNAPAGYTSDIRNINLINENILSFNKIIKKEHNFHSILGASYQKSATRFAAMGIIPNSYSNTVVKTLNNAVISPTLSRTTKTSWGLESYFGRINYDFKEKYLFAASLRTDGSSRFAPNNKWGLFPSASIAWRVSEEDFLKGNKVISDLKLRASYGVTGNFNIPDFAYLGGISDVYYSPGGVLTKGQAQTSFGNPDLSWEENKSYDIGLEAGFLNDRINIVFDYYDKTTSGLLYQEAIPATTGFTTSLRNTGKVNNRGAELELNTRNLIGAFKWGSAFNITRNRNKVTSLGGVQERINTDTYGMSWILRVGEPMFSYYGFKAIGVLQDAQDVANSPILAGSLPGNTKYMDVNKDGTINSADRVILGSFLPKYFFGFVNDFAWKNFDLRLAMQASVGAKLYNFENENYQGALAGAMRRSLVETQWWSNAEPGDGRMPGAALSKLTWQANSDIYVENASFLIVRNLNLGYTLPKSLTAKLGIKDCRIYTSIKNLFKITDNDFHGYNPEGYTWGEISGLNSKPGYNRGSDPMSRTYALGLNVNF